MEDYPLSAVVDCVFNLFAATLHIGGRSSIRNLRTRHAVVTGTHTHGLTYITILNSVTNVPTYFGASAPSSRTLCNII